MRTSFIDTNKLPHWLCAKGIKMFQASQEQIKIYDHGSYTEQSKLVKQILVKELANELKEFNLKLSVRMASCAYGGPRIKVSTGDAKFIPLIKVLNIKTKTILIIESGNFDRSLHDYLGVEKGVDHLIINNKIKKILNQFGENNSDVMRDYFDNSKPIFSGIEYSGI